MPWLITRRLPVVLVCVMTALLASVGAQAMSAAPGAYETAMRRWPRRPGGIHDAL
jgi:hypothetical protein